MKKVPKSKIINDKDILCDSLSKEDLEGEIWKDVVGYDGTHSVSNLGRVKRENRHDSKGRLLKEKILKRSYWISKNGYIEAAKVSIGKNGKHTTKSVPILVAESFIGEIKDGFCVIHKDKNIRNDNVKNLKIGTYSNSLKIDYKKRVKKDWGFGVAGNIGKNKIVEQLDLNGNVIKEFDSLGAIERALKIKKQPISAICRGRWKDKPHYTAYGYRWRFKKI